MVPTTIGSVTELMVHGESMTADQALADRLLATVGLIRRRTRRAVGAPFEGQLSQAQTEVVRHVRRHPGASVKETARALALAPNTVSTLVASLVEAGMIVRQPDPNDLRVARLALTAQARGSLETWRSQRLAAVVSAVATLTASQRDDLERGLTALQSIADHLAEGSGDD